MRVTVTEIERALRVAAGVRTAAAERLGISRQALARRIQASARLQRVVAEVEDNLLDMAEAKILQSVQAGDLSSARYLLDRKGRARGWGSRTEITGPAGAPVTFNLTELSDDDLDRLEQAVQPHSPARRR